MAKTKILVKDGRTVGTLLGVAVAIGAACVAQQTDGVIVPSAEDKILASRPGVFGPPPTAEEFARSRLESERLRRQMLARLPEMKRLPPSSFSDLPKRVAAELARRGCTIPQTAQAEPHNVIHGEFARPGQQDWAVFCSTRDTSDTSEYRGYTTRLLVFWNGSADNPAEFEPFWEGDYLFMNEVAEANVDDPARGLYFYRSISAASRDYITAHDRAYGQAERVSLPPTLDHQGIDDGFYEKASIVHYFHEGEWLQLAGAD